VPLGSDVIARARRFSHAGSSRDHELRRGFACTGRRDAHRVKAAVLAAALVLSVLVGESTVAGSVRSRPLAKTLAAYRIREKGGGGTSAASSEQLTRGSAATNRGDDSRDGWYPDEAGLTPQVVGSSGFGQLFATKLNGQIYAQPLLVGHVLLVATEADWVYGLSPVTGAIEWSRQIGKPFRDASLHCGDLLPDLGVTSTPAVDPATGIAYLVDQTYLSGDSGPVGWFVNAINPTTGREMPHFPVQIKGPASNNPRQPFTPTKELQRPGLLFLGGVVYAAFGSHCDFPPFSGLIVGVSTRGRQTTMWDVEGTGSGGGGGIWQGGGGLVSDGPGQILFASGNGYGAATTHPSGPIRGSAPPENLADSVVRLAVQPDGSLKAKSFFSMWDDATVDRHDWDFAGAPVVLPKEFSTPKYPRLLVATGKEGVVYLLNRNSLGGVGEGPDGRDLVVGEYGPNGDAISTAGAWPGDGGYVYVATLQNAKGGAGRVDAYKFITTSKGLPGLHLVAISSQPMVFGVSGPLVTSNGTESGSAVVWVIDGANLQAYSPVPVNGRLELLGTWFVGSTNPFNPPGIGDNMVYVGNQAGLLYGFGMNASPHVRLSGRMRGSPFS